ncbi:hypothetical protein GCM10010329_81050 [Streptomyces spiroverticillatus]|uniref:Uncharacterized protein n=1 Tax=Streptomyces finlayi TaxID=67296 RepID=A0A918X843_9ACTN|nr:hypothetical protein GCM10010329_81050 [Streptomyces spiroverticillatus]GHD16384.1 hypothetical protein GCM10010334_77440 [Streptomyces finlayi]
MAGARFHRGSGPSGLPQHLCPTGDYLKEENVRTASKALTVCTAASLIASIVTAITMGFQPLIWATWALLAVITVAVIAGERRGAGR